jgi:hypothetical protein
MFTSKTLCQIILTVKDSEQRDDTASQRIDVDHSYDKMKDKMLHYQVLLTSKACLFFFFFFFFSHRNAFKENGWKVVSTLILTEIRVSREYPCDNWFVLNLGNSTVEECKY